MKRKKSITEADVKKALNAKYRDIASVREVLRRRGRAARRKGQQSERDIAALVRRVFPDAKRGIGQARFGRECPDVDGTPYWIETKCGKNAPVRSALKQAIADTDGRTPVVIVKDDRCEPFVVLRLKDWLDDMWHPDAADPRAEDELTQKQIRDGVEAGRLRFDRNMQLVSAKPMDEADGGDDGHKS